MQFMITRHTQKSSWDKFEVQDIAIEKFRKFATEHNVSFSNRTHLSLFKSDIWLTVAIFHSALFHSHKGTRHPSRSSTKRRRDIKIVNF